MHFYMPRRSQNENKKSPVPRDASGHVFRALHPCCPDRFFRRVGKPSVMRREGTLTLLALCRAHADFVRRETATGRLLAAASVQPEKFP